MLTPDEGRSLACDLALQLGFPSPDALMSSLTEDEWAAWCRWWDRKCEGA